MGRPHAKTAKPVTQVGPSDSQKVRRAARPLRFLTETSEQNNSGPGYKKRSVRRRFDICRGRGPFGQARSYKPQRKMALMCARARAVPAHPRPDICWSPVWLANALSVCGVRKAVAPVKLGQSGQELVL